jgi:hypothetical protein
MTTHVTALAAGLLVGAMFRPWLQTTWNRANLAMMQTRLIRYRLPLLWILMGHDIRHLAYILEIWRRGWFSCDTCGRRWNIQYPGMCGAQRTADGGAEYCGTCARCLDLKRSGNRERR